MTARSLWESALELQTYLSGDDPHGSTAPSISCYIDF